MAKSLQFVLCLRQGKTKRACRREFYDLLNAQYREEINMLWEDAFRAAPQDADEAAAVRAQAHQSGIWAIQTRTAMAAPRAPAAHQALS